MSQEENYKERMQRLLDAQHFAYNDKAWESTRQYIDAMNRKRRRVVAAWLSAGLLLLGTGALLLLIPVNNTNENPGPNAGKPHSQLKARDHQPGSALKKTQALTREAALLSTHTEVTKNHIMAEEQKPMPAKQTPEREGLIAERAVSTTATTPDKKIDTPTSPDTPTSVRAGTLDENPDPLAAITTVTTMSQSSPTTAVLLTETEDARILPDIAEHPVAPLTATALITADPPVSGVDSLQKSDSLSRPMAPRPALGDSSKMLLPFSYLALEAGLGFSPQLGSDALTNGRDLNPSAGISFNKYLNRNLLLSFGLGYNRVSGLKPSTITSKHILYSYGEESAVTAVTPERLHYLCLPIRAGWQFKPGHSLWAGYTISYLFNAEARVEKYNQSINRTDGYTSYMAGGYTEGFRIFDSQLALLYRVRLRKELWMQAEFAYGLTDVKDNGFFRSQSYERNNSIRLTLVYGFLQLK
jgi:hypothetical protein